MYNEENPSPSITITKTTVGATFYPEWIDIWTPLLCGIVEQKIAQERERCAKIADDYNMLDERPESYTARDIARAIRSGA